MTTKVSEAIDLMFQRLREGAAEPVIRQPHPSGDGYLYFVRDAAGGYKLAQHYPGPRVPTRRHVFASAAYLATFLRARSGEESVTYDAASCDVLVGRREIVVTTAPTDPDTDRLTCPLSTHPEWRPWAAVVGKGGAVQSQRALMQLVRASERALGAEQAAKWITTLGVLRVVGGGKVESEIDQTGYTRLRGSEQTREVTTSIPPTLKLEVPLFAGILDAMDVELRYPLEVLVEFNPEDLDFRLSCPLLDLVQEEALEDVRAMLARLLDDPFLVLRAESEFLDVPAVYADEAGA